MQNLIPILITAVAIATLINVVLKRINMPTVIGYIFTGALLALSLTYIYMVMKDSNM